MATSPEIEYRIGPAALPPGAFVELAARIWPRAYDAARVVDALSRSINVGAWYGDRLVGSVRVLSDGYLFNTIPEVMVDPAFQRRGIGRELMHRALEWLLWGECSSERFLATSHSLNGPV